MLIVKICINEREVARMHIHNDGTGDAKTGNYDAEIVEHSTGMASIARVEGYPRSIGAVELVRRALNAISERGEA